MSIEVIPRDFREPYDLFSDVNHDIVRDYTRHRLLSDDEVLTKLQHEYDVNLRRYPDFLKRLIERGKFLEPVNDELEFIDKEMTNMRMFNTGFALACATLDSLAFEMRVDERDWRQRWTELPQESDFPSIDDGREEDEPTSDDCMKIGNRLLANGQQAYERLPKPYQELFEEVEDAYLGAMANPQIFRSTYGYVLRFGEKVIYSFSAETRLDDAVEEATSSADVDREIINLISKRERRLLRKKVKAMHKK